jgi:hypothetical protein
MPYNKKYLSSGCSVIFYSIFSNDPDFRRHSKEMLVGKRKAGLRIVPDP